MASRLAILLAAPSADEDDTPNDDAVAWCDHKLQRVRDVLKRMQRQPQQTPPCWCIQWWPNGHDGVCKDARALWSELLPRQEDAQTTAPAARELVKDLEAGEKGKEDER